METDNQQDPTRTQPRSAANTQPPSGGRVAVTRKDIIRRIVIIVAIVGALTGLFFTGRYATTGLESTSDARPDNVDRLIPESGAEVLRQSQVGIDVAEGYKAYLIINGTEITSPEQGLISDLGTGLVLMQPGPGKDIESLNEGRNCVVAMVWKATEDTKTAKPVSWCFDAT